VCSNPSYGSFDLLLLQKEFKKKQLRRKCFCKILVAEAKYKVRNSPAFDGQSSVKDLKNE